MNKCAKVEKMLKDFTCYDTICSQGKLIRKHKRKSRETVQTFEYEHFLKI